MCNRETQLCHVVAKRSANLNEPAYNVRLIELISTALRRQEALVIRHRGPLGVPNTLKYALFPFPQNTCPQGRNCCIARDGEGPLALP